ncbi:uncharacterized protein LOC141875405 [Acropora palmata]|uniref:uncharacterized protein LOC141875405 n=1 Tax=Acropora palmata TaxID=6131 RepID=UPI003DA19864
MEEEHRTILRKNRQHLIRDLEPLKILNDLAQIFDEDDRDEVKAESTRKEQVEVLLDMLPRKGPKVFEDFLRALNKRQPHLAYPMIDESRVDFSKAEEGNVGMSSKHKQILRHNAEVFQGITKLEDLVLRLHLKKLLDDVDKDELLDDTRAISSRKTMLVTDILPRKGPGAFDCFVKELYIVNPKVADILLKDSGLKVPPVDEKPSSPVQDTGSFDLEELVQDVLESHPQILRNFGKLMDKENVFEYGWQRFYQKLDLPPGKEEKMQGRGEGPTMNCIKGWISLKGRDATVKALLEAVHGTERKDCLLNLETGLGCRLDFADDGVDEVTRKMESLTSKEGRTVKFFGDLTESEASQLVEKLGIGSQQLLREKLGANESVTTETLIKKSIKYPIRQFTDMLSGDQRQDIIKTFREVVRVGGITGPLSPPNKFVRDLSFCNRRTLTTELCVNENWKTLADNLGLTNTQISFFDNRCKNPADEVLKYWEVKAASTVGILYDILVELKFAYIADCL